jgi:hypothetical protein
MKSNATTSLLMECLHHVQAVGEESSERINAITGVIRDTHQDRLRSLPVTPAGTSDQLLVPVKPSPDDYSLF